MCMVLASLGLFAQQSHVNVDWAPQKNTEQSLLKFMMTVQ